LNRLASPFGIAHEFRFAYQFANLKMILNVEFLPAQLLDREMFGIGGPRAQRVGRLPFKQREPLPVFRDITLVRYVTGHVAGEFAHAKEPLSIFLTIALRRAPSAKYNHHHHLPPVPPPFGAAGWRCMILPQRQPSIS